MGDQLETFSEVRQIRLRIEAIEHTQEVLVRAHSEAIEKQIWDEMDKDGVMAQVYLHVDGKRSQTDIANALQTKGVPGASQATVSRKLDKLANQLHLVELVAHSKTGKTYRRTAIDRILGIGRKLGKRLAKPPGDPK